MATTNEASDSAARAWERLGPDLHSELPPPFPSSEYEDRWRRVRRELQHAELDMIFVSDPADLCYLTGYQLAWNQDAGPPEWAAATGMAIHVDHETPIFFDTADERLIGTATAHNPDYRICEQIEASADRAEERGFEYITGFIVDSLLKEGWLRGTVGLQRWSYRPAPGYSDAFRNALAERGARVGDGSAVVPEVRRLKSERELACVREAARLGDVGMRAAAGAAAEGVSELEIWAEACLAMAREGGELSAIPGMVNSGPKSASLHGLATGRRLRRGDFVNIDMCGVKHRYHANLARTLVLGAPSSDTLAAMSRIPDFYRSVTSEYKPGMTFREIVDINERIARDLGIWDDRWWIGGYDIGIAFAPDWVGWSYFSCGEDPGDHVLEPRMVMNHEFNFYLPDGSTIRELIDTMVVGESEVEFLSTFPIDLTVVG